MNRYIKVRFVKDGQYITDRTYIYKTSLDVQLGETVQCDERLKGVIVSFVPIYDIARPETIKEIVGQIGKEGVDNDIIR